MKNFIAILLLVLGCQLNTIAQDNSDTFTIYLVRHSEKVISGDHPADPALTPCGDRRSESLSKLLKEVPLDAVYSTDYTRTKETAKPTAKSQDLTITLYDGQTLSDFSKLLISRKQDALVVGHSNTTGVLAGLLIGEEIGEFDPSIYNRVYQVVFYKSEGRLHLLHTSFECTE